MANRSPARCLISGFTICTTPGSWSSTGRGPYFYLPKLESHLEARLWNEVFLRAQQTLGQATGSIKATVLIETLPAAFEMDEILWELREHIAGLNAGRWDYIFSFIKKFALNPAFVLPDRSQVVMGKAFLHAYALLLIKTCHRRGAFAMGGMAAQIPVKNNPAANEAAFAKVRADKEREATDGHDGTWVAHPDLVPVAREVFDRVMPTANQARSPPTGGRGQPRAAARDPSRHQDRGGVSREHPGRNSISRGLVARPRRGADLQSHGRRCDRRDRPGTNLAMDHLLGRAREWREGDARVFRPCAVRRDGAGQERDRHRRLCGRTVCPSDRAVSQTLARSEV